MKQATCNACGARLAAAEGEADSTCPECDAVLASRKKKRREQGREPKSAPVDDFDPMDVLNAPVKQPVTPEPVSAPPEQVESPTVNEPVPSRKSSASSATAGAAESAMAAMNRPTVPQPRAALAPSPTSTPDTARSIRDLIKSPGDVVELLRERPIYGVLLCAGILWIAVFASRGCNDNRVPTYPVRGRVVFADSSVVRTGKIEFESDEYGTTSTGSINEDGSFVLGTYESSDGAPAGTHRVIVMQLVIQDPTIKHSKDHGAPVDPRFGRYETSGLTATVRPEDGNNVTISVEPRLDPSGQHNHE